MGPTVTGGADMSIGTGPLECALPFVPRNTYARPWVTTSTGARADRRGVLGGLVADGIPCGGIGAWALPTA